MTFSGNVNVLDAPGAVDKSKFKAQFLVPTKTDIEALQSGSGIAMTGPVGTAANIAVGSTLLVRTAGVTYVMTLAEFNKGQASFRPFLTAGDLGMAGDGVTDDAPALQRAFDTWGALGGAGFFLKAQPGKSFFFKGTPRGADNCLAIFGSPHTVTRTSRLTLQGALATTSAASGFRLLADVAAGDASISLDAAAVGGGVLSAYLAVGDTLHLTGLRDSCGTALQAQDVRITSIDDGTGFVGISPVAAYAYSVTYTAGDFEAAQGVANVTLASKVITATASGDVAAGATLWPINSGDIGKLVEGDMVLAFDEGVSTDADGSTTHQINVEMARIAPSISGDSVASVRLNRTLERAYTTANHARLLKVDPIINASIQGATVEFTEAPGVTDFAHCFEIMYGSDCRMQNCSVPNTDLFGTRGTGHRIWRSLACGIEDPIANGARYFGAGEGYGAALVQSTDCWINGGSFSGMRHGVLFQTSTNCFAENPTIAFPRQAPVDFHGLNEIGCRVINPTCKGAASHESGSGVSPNGIVFGNVTHLAGSHRCGVEGGRFSGFKGEAGTDKPLIQFIPPSTGCYVEATKFQDIGLLYLHQDTPGFGSLVSSGHRISGISVDGCARWLFYVDSRANGAVINTLSDLAVSNCSFRNISLLHKLVYGTELQFYDNEYDEITPDATNSYTFDADTCPDLYIADNKIKGASRFVKLTNCTGLRVLDNQPADQGAVTVFNDAGGNTGVFARNDSPGYIANSTRTGGSVITEYPYLAGTVAIADDSVFKFKPRRAQGLCTVATIGANTVFGTFRYCVSGTAACALEADTKTANINATTGTLAGTTGTDTKFTVSAHTDGVIYLENRTGSSVTIDASCD